MRTVDISIDDATLARAEAYAANKRTTIEHLVNYYLECLGDDIAGVPLPAGASSAFLRMLRHGGRDTTARFLDEGGWDAFERPMPALLFAWARAVPGLVIDGGANTGFYSLLAANAGPDTHVLAFEPDPAVRALLVQNVAANGLEAQVTIRAEALTDHVGEASLFVPSQDHGMIETSASLEASFKSYFSGVLQVPTVTVDAVADAPEFAGRSVSLIKTDVAGHEASVLAGAERTIARDRPVVFLEVLDRADFGRLSDLVARHNYLDVPLRNGAALAGKAAVTFERDAWNHALVPAEKLPRFLAAGRSY